MAAEIRLAQCALGKSMHEDMLTAQGFLREGPYFPNVSGEAVSKAAMVRMIETIVGKCDEPLINEA
eukprot:4195967-Amphidinium_carterae.1